MLYCLGFSRSVDTGYVRYLKKKSCRTYRYIQNETTVNLRTLHAAENQDTWCQSIRWTFSRRHQRI